ncbi:MAG TPA: hypothetical protein VJ907_05340 [Halanaerobiales bacterium]|nr:hypothetical protein [Halanaerobiales bacterium]
MIISFDSKLDGFFVEVKKKSDLFYQLIKKKSFDLLENKNKFIIGFIDYDDVEFEFNKDN